MKESTSLKNQSVINSISFAVVIMAVSLFFFIPYIMGLDTIQTVVKNSKIAAEKIKLTRAYYIDSVVKDVKKYAPEITFAYNHAGTNGRLPYPTTSVHDLSKIYSENTNVSYNLYSAYPFKNRESRVLNDAQKEALKFMDESTESNPIYVKRDIINGKEVVRVVISDVMTQQSCVDCHNNHPDKTWGKYKWKLGDKRGVIEVITPIDEEIASHALTRNYILLFIVVTLGSLIFYLVYRIRKREKELQNVADDLKDTVNDRDKELETLAELVDNHVISSKSDINGKITYVSQAFVEISEYSEEELIGQPHSIIRHPDMQDAVFKEMWTTILAGKTWSGEIKNLKKSGDYYWVDAVVSADYDKENKIIGFSAIRTDISSQKEAYYLAYHDFLTSLPNKTKFQEIATHAIQIAEQERTSLAVLFLDFDNFKNINDTQGHQAGDEMLRIIATRMQKALREVDTVARIGGDEFVILLESIQDVSEIPYITDILLEVIREPLDIFGKRFHTSASIGISVFPNDGTNVTALMQNADGAMYHAKDQGRDNYKFYTQELNIKLSRKIEVENAIRTAVENDGFNFVYQPKYDLKTQKSTSCEILIRLANEKMGVISPSEFIPIAEANRMIIDIGDVVFAQACMVLKQWKQIGLGVDMIAINISSLQLEQDNIVDHFVAMTKKYNVPPSCIELELTEYSMVQNLDKNIKKLKKLRSLGFQVSIDDFGTGYSSMSYLKELPIDTIKIDKAFVDDISLDKKDSAIANSIIQLSLDLGYKVIAEGIEDKFQEDILIDLGCQMGQGYFFSKWLTYNDFIKFISANKLT